MGSTGGRSLGTAVVLAALVLCFYLYVLLCIDPRLVYYSYGLTSMDRSFARSMVGLTEFVRYRGGLVQFAASQLSQLFFYSALGALIITCVTCALCVLTDVLVRALGGERLRAAALVPAVFVLLLLGQYSNHLPALLAMLTALAFAVLYVHVPVRNGAARLVCMLAFAALLFYLAAGACMLFLVLCGILELSKRKWSLGVLALGFAVLYAVLGIVVPYAADAKRLDLSVYQTCARLLPFHFESDPTARPWVLALWGYFPLAGVFVVAWSRLVQRRSRVGNAPGEPAGGSRWSRLWRHFRASSAGRVFVYQSLALLIVAILTLTATFDWDGQTLIQLHAAAENEQWTEVLERALSLKREVYFLGVYWDVCRALYHTGRLPYDMFIYPQSPMGVDSILIAIEDLAGPSVQLMQLSALTYELGLMNHSERFAYEAIELLEERPEILQRLALIASVKGQSEVVRTYLGALSKDPIYGSWSRARRARLQSDPSLSSDPEVQRLRAAMMPEDRIIGWLTIEETLKELQKSPGGNRMAYELLMAHYLLKGELEPLVSALDALERHGYSQMPKLYEEAALLYVMTTGRTDALHGREISAATRERLEQFQRALAQHGGRRGGQAAVARQFGSSYFYYYTFYAPEGNGT